MPEHPLLPMRNSLYRSQVIGKASSSGPKVTLYMYADSSSMWPEEASAANFEFVIGEVNNSSDYNYVRTAGTISGTLDSTTYSSDMPGTLIGTTTLTLNEDTNTVYLITGSIVSAFYSYGAITYQSAADDGNGYGVSQAASYSVFESSNEVDRAVDAMASKGSGWPSASYSQAIAYDNSFKVNHNGTTGDPIWMWINIS